MYRSAFLANTFVSKSFFLPSGLPPVLRTMFMCQSFFSDISCCLKWDLMGWVAYTSEQEWKICLVPILSPDKSSWFWITSVFKADGGGWNIPCLPSILWKAMRTSGVPLKNQSVSFFLSHLLLSASCYLSFQLPFWRISTLQKESLLLFNNNLSFSVQLQWMHTGCLKLKNPKRHKSALKIVRKTCALYSNSTEVIQ